MADDYRSSNQRNNRRPRHRNRGSGSRGGDSSRGNRQRPLLSTATQAAGFSFLGLVLTTSQDAVFKAYIMVALSAFVLSALISYVAQRVSKPWAEKLSDVFFVAGLAIWIYIAALSAGLI
jgi:hypothetical protein